MTGETQKMAGNYRSPAVICSPENASFMCLISDRICFPSRPGIIHLVCTQIFQKTNNSYPLIRTRTCAYQGVLTCAYQRVRNVNFSENFAYVPNE